MLIRATSAGRPLRRTLRFRHAHAAQRPAGAGRADQHGGRLRAWEKGETEGFMKMLVDAESKQILGGSFLGVSGDEAIHCIVDLMYAKAPYTVATARRSHPSDRRRIHSDDARGSRTAEVRRSSRCADPSRVPARERRRSR